MRTWQRLTGILFIYGMIAAFGECVAQEVKSCIQPSISPSDLKLLEEEAERIMREQGLSLLSGRKSGYSGGMKGCTGGFCTNSPRFRNEYRGG